MATANTVSSSMELLKALIRLESAGIPLDDFTNALIELALMDRYIGMDLVKVFEYSSQTNGLHGLDHSVRVVFWVLYLVEISNRLGYPINEEEALAAVLAALVHDLSRMDDLPGGVHGEIASKQFRSFLEKQLSPELLGRCLAAIAQHGFFQEPEGYDPIWMLLKDADALDRSRFAVPGTGDGVDPTRLRLPVLRENTPVLDGCLTMSILLPSLIHLVRTEKAIFREMTDQLIKRMNTDSGTQDASTQQAVRLITDRYYASF